VQLITGVVEQMLSMKGLSKQFVLKNDRINAVDNINLTVQPGRILTLFGPSGCGKTTLLRLVAGLEHPDKGIIRIRDKIVYDSGGKINIPPNKRGIGMVFQSCALWPHLNVYENVAFPLKVVSRQNGFSARYIREKVMSILDMVQLSGYDNRFPDKLSGGQQQRVALARALIREPDLLLLDEPLSNLDLGLKIQMQKELIRIHEKTKITMVYVTHDIHEALELSDELAMMEKGRITEIRKRNESF
jgi:iron(III) transport system ATP-binding protein